MLSRVLILLLMMSVPSLMQAQREKLPPDDYEWVTKNFPSAKKSNTGIRYIEIESGAGEKINRGDKVSVLYVGRFINGETFDKQIDPQSPLEFRVGRREVILAWDQILQLMSPGAKWLVIVPSELGYGTRGSPPKVPPETTLIFTIQVMSVERS
jgi:FKBP-type peptidyl-prolyl cis-trans isomerase